MDDGLKQRLIGAVVLLALAVIFVPVIFDREQLEPVSRTSQVPVAPDIEPVTVPEPEPPASIDNAPPTDEIFVAEPAAPPTADPEPQPAPQTPPQPSLDEKGVPEAWTLQVASFSSGERADEMRKTLEAEGYDVYTQRVQGAGGELTRVFVGPKLDKGRLLSAQKAIEEQFGFSSTLILRFEP